MKRTDIPSIRDIAVTKKADRILKGKPFNDEDELVLVTKSELRKLFGHLQETQERSGLALTCEVVALYMDGVANEQRIEHIDALYTAIEFDLLRVFAITE